jgi:3-oxoacyl-[acyl-carrier protein] reductase
MNPAEAFDLRGKVAIVTGGAGDIGAAITTTLAQAGATVVAADLDADAASAVADRIVASGGRARGAALDVRTGSRGRRAGPTPYATSAAST